MVDRSMGFVWRCTTKATAEQIAELERLLKQGDLPAFDALKESIDHPRPARRPVFKTQSGDAAARGRAKFTQTTFENACRLVAETPEGARNPTLARMSYKLGMFVGGGHLDEMAARDGLLDAGRKCGLADGECLKTIDNSLKKGMQIPFVFRGDQ